MVDFNFKDDFSTYSISKLPTFRDDFSGADNWADVGGLGWGVNIGTDVIDWVGNVTTVNGNNGTSIELGSVNDKRWVLRFKLDITTITNGVASNSARVLVGLSSADETVGTRSAQDHIYAEFLTNVSNPQIIVVGADGVGFDAGTFSVLSTTPSVSTTFVELKRTSATNVQLTLYSDSKYETIIETGSITIPSTLASLRYIRVASDSNAGTPDHTFNGTVDNMEFWNGRKTVPSFEDMFTVDNWADTGTGFGVNVGTELLDGSLTLNGADNHTSFDLNPILGGNVSDTAWVLRFKVKILTLVATGSTGFTFAIDSAEPNGGLGGPTRSLLAGAFDLFNSIPLAYGVGNHTPADASVLSIQALTASKVVVPIALNTDYFVEFKRTSATENTMRVFTDSDYSIPLAALSQRNIPATTVGLRYIKFYDRELNTSGSMTFEVDDIEFYDGVSEVPKVIGAQQGDITAQDDFTVDNWTDVGTGFGVNVGTEVLDWDSLDETVNNGTWFDLGVQLVSDTKWVLRFKLNIDNLTNGVAAQSSKLFVGLSDLDGNTDSDTIKDWIGFNVEVNNAVNQFRVQATDNTSPNDAGGGAFGTAGVNTRYVELRRTSSTTAVLNLYSDVDFTILVATQAITPTVNISSLRYLVIQNGRVAGSDSVLDGTIDDLEFYDGVSATKTPVKGDIGFEDNFWEDNWSQTGTQIAVNTGTQLIDCDWRRNGAIDQETIDLLVATGTAISDSKWGLRWKVNLITATAGATASQMAVWLTNQAGGTSSESAQDHVTYTTQLSSNGDRLSNMFADDNTQIFTGQARTVGINLIGAGDIFYVEMTRNGTLFSIALYRDPDFTDLIAKGTMTDLSAISNLRYLKVGKRDNVASTTGSYTGTIDEIKFWNGSLPTEHGSVWVEVVSA